MVCVTVVSVLYLAISLTVGEGIDLGAREEKPLLARIFVMYAVAATVNLISNFERSRWRAAVERERELQRERIELSQAIHDTAAQTAFMIGLGIDAAKQVGHRRGQLGDHGGLARLGAQPGRDDVRLRLA